MKKRMMVWMVAVCAAGTIALAVPLEWGGHYYELVSSSGIWDEARTAAEGLSYNGYFGHLVTLNSEAEFNFVKTLPDLGDWNISWIGASLVGGEYVWVNGEGALDFSGWSQSPWESGEPSGNYGIAITGAGYGSNIRTQPGDCGEYIVEYQAIPEPATALILGLGGGLIALYRRFFGRA